MIWDMFSQAAGLNLEDAMAITPTGAIVPAIQPPLPGRGQVVPGSGFFIPEALVSSGRPNAGGSAVSVVRGAGSVLALQEQATQEPADPVEVADREARRHGKDMLEALTALQMELLAAAEPEASLARLTALVDSGPQPHDPVLARILSAIRLRARLELLRSAAANGGGAASRSVTEP